MSGFVSGLVNKHCMDLFHPCKQLSRSDSIFSFVYCMSTAFFRTFGPGAPGAYISETIPRSTMDSLLFLCFALRGILGRVGGRGGKSGYQRIEEEERQEGEGDEDGGEEGEEDEEDEEKEKSGVCR